LLHKNELFELDFPILAFRVHGSGQVRIKWWDNQRFFNYSFGLLCQVAQTERQNQHQPNKRLGEQVCVETIDNVGELTLAEDWLRPISSALGKVLDDKENSRENEQSD